MRPLRERGNTGRAMRGSPRTQRKSVACSLDTTHLVSQNHFVKTTRTIRIDREVWEAIKRRATEPLEDTPNRILRRLLGLDDAARG